MQKTSASFVSRRRTVRIQKAISEKLVQARKRVHNNIESIYAVLDSPRYYFSFLRSKHCTIKQLLEARKNFKAAHLVFSMQSKTEKTRQLNGDILKMRNAIVLINEEIKKRKSAQK